MKSMFLGRRQSSKPKQNDSGSAAANELDKLKVDSIEESVSEEEPIVIEESRDDLNPFERFFNDSSCALSIVFSEAVSMADDIQTIISADIDDDIDDDDKEVVIDDDFYDDKEVVKGSHSDLAKEIKKLGKLGRRKEKAEKQIRKCENEIAMAEAERGKTLIKIKALSQKFELHDVMDHDDERNEGSFVRTSHDDVSV